MINDVLVLHSTSNCDINVSSSQIVTDPIQELIKSHAKNPGTIISLNAKCEPHYAFKSVRRVNIESIIKTSEEELASRFGINELELNYSDYLAKKHQIIEGVYYSFTSDKSNWSLKILSEIKNGV